VKIDQEMRQRVCSQTDTFTDRLTDGRKPVLLSVPCYIIIIIITWFI